MAQAANMPKIKYRSLNSYLKETYGSKVYKIALDGGFTCPNRDGKIDNRGCIFCSAGGSGDFAQNRNLTINDQIEAGKALVEGKMSAGEDRLYIAYLQAFTNTYGPLSRLREIYSEALKHPQVVALSIATRPDCINAENVELLVELKERFNKDIWVELGLQTMHETTAKYIRRGYGLEIYDKALSLLKTADIKTVTHVILGLPGESEEDMLATVDYVGRSSAWGIKLQLLHVLKGTDLLKDYEAGEFRVMEEERYISLICRAISILPPDMVIHRMTGDGDKKLLVAPMWSANKRQVHNKLHKYLEER